MKNFFIINKVAGTKQGEQIVKEQVEKLSSEQKAGNEFIFRVTSRPKEATEIAKSICDTYQNEEVNVFDEIMPIDIQDSSFIKSLTINRGVIAYISYSKQDITYTFEETGSKELIKAKLDYKAAESKLLEEYKNHNNTRESIVQAKAERDLAYQKFLILLNKTITAYKEANGIIS